MPSPRRGPPVSGTGRRAPPVGPGAPGPAVRAASAGGARPVRRRAAGSPLEVLLAAADPVHRHGHVPSGDLAQPLHARAEVVRPVAVGDPGVTEFGDPAEPALAAADVDGRVRPLHRLGPGEDGVEIDEPAVELGLVRGPQLAHRPQAFVGEQTPRGGVGTVVAHLLAVPADADTEDGAAVGDQVEGGHLLGRVDRVALRDQGDPGAQQQAPGDGGDHGQGDEGVEGAVVHLRQFAAPGIGALAAHRDVAVLRDEQRVERPFLQGGPERGGADALVGDEGRDPDFHDGSVGCGGEDWPRCAAYPARGAVRPRPPGRSIATGPRRAGRPLSRPPRGARPPAPARAGAVPRRAAPR